MKKAFTLVELIVVITILAILGTIAFISLNSYSASARDAKRLSDIRSLYTKLTLENTKGVKYETLVETEEKYELQIGGETRVVGQGIVNFENLKENRSAFQDPQGYDYRVAYSEAGLELVDTTTSSIERSYIELGTISEKEGVAVTIGNYSQMDSDDTLSLLTIEDSLNPNVRIPIINDENTLPYNPGITPKPSNCEAGGLDGFSVVETPHRGSSVGEKIGVNIGEGTQTIRQNFECYNGVFTKLGEEEITNICDTGYYYDGAQCSTQWTKINEAVVFMDENGIPDYPKNCNELLTNSKYNLEFPNSIHTSTHFANDWYMIKSTSTREPFSTYCVMDMYGGGRTLTHMRRYENLNKAYADSIGYTGLVFTSANYLWNGRRHDGVTHVIPFKDLEYTSWVWLSGSTPSEAHITNKNPTYVSNGRKQDMDNYISYWYNGLKVGERPDYIVYSGEVVGGVENVISTNCTPALEKHVKGRRNGDGVGFEVLLSSDFNVKGGACSFLQGPSVPFQFSFPSGGVGRVSISGLDNKTYFTDTTMYNSLWVK